MFPSTSYLPAQAAKIQMKIGCRLLLGVLFGLGLVIFVNNLDFFITRRDHSLHGLSGTADMDIADHPKKEKGNRGHRRGSGGSSSGDTDISGAGRGRSRNKDSTTAVKSQQRAEEKVLDPRPTTSNKYNNGVPTSHEATRLQQQQQPSFSTNHQRQQTAATDAQNQQRPAAQHNSATSASSASSYSSSSGSGVTSFNVTSSEASTGTWDPLPDWWQEAWQRSLVFDNKEDQFLGDTPFFPPCVSSALHNLHPFVEPREYLENSKNPCWYEQPKTQRGLRCLPYMYLAGVAKCGTSDLAKRLRKHYEVYRGTKKEYHWWERFRFGMYDDDNPEATVKRKEGQSFKEYLDDITGEEINLHQKELRDTGSSRNIFGDYSPSYLWDPQNWYALEGNQGCQEPRVIVAQHIRHVYPAAKIIMTFRHPTPRLYSRFMSRIPRTPWLKKATVQDFHQYVSDGIKVYMSCFKKRSIRQCAYSNELYKTSVVRLVEGMYPAFMADWLRVWRRDQMYIMRYEDYGGHEKDRIEEIFDFLDLAKLNKTQMDEVLEIELVNSGSEEYQKYGSMLPETKKLLDDFYQPFIQQFARLLNDARFLWKDVYQ